MTPVLDSHVFLWWVSDSRRLSRDQRRLLGRVSEDDPAVISDITLWEIATLAQLGRIRLKMPLREWFETALDRPYVKLNPITAAIATEVASLPDSFHRDPADRIIVATCRVLGSPLLTLDDRIIESELVPTVS